VVNTELEGKTRKKKRAEVGTGCPCHPLFSSTFVAGFERFGTVCPCHWA